MTSISVVKTGEVLVPLTLAIVTARARNAVLLVPGAHSKWMYHSRSMISFESGCHLYHFESLLRYYYFLLWCYYHREGQRSKMWFHTKNLIVNMHNLSQCGRWDAVSIVVDVLFRLIDKVKSVKCRALIGTLSAAKSTSINRWRKLVQLCYQVVNIRQGRFHFIETWTRPVRPGKYDGNENHAYFHKSKREERLKGKKKD